MAADINSLLSQASEALQRGDQKAAGIIINQILALDFTNEGAWHLLHQMLGKDISYENFQLQFAQRYYPGKTHLLRNFETRTKGRNAHQRATKKCPYCAEDILVEANICRFCGRDLTKEPPEVIAQKRNELTQKLTELEKNLASQETYLQEMQLIAQQAGRQVTWSLVAIILGALSIPFGIGIILLPAGILAAITQSGKRSTAERNQTSARQNIEKLRQRISETRTEIANLP